MSQVVIKPKGQEPEDYEVAAKRFEKVKFGAVLTKDVLTEAMALQNILVNITAKVNGQTVSLEDVCYKPLAPDNNNCAIMSPLQWFQNSQDNLDKTRGTKNYKDHMYYCARWVPIKFAQLNENCFESHLMPF